jgi:hypothetical protein
MRSSTLKIFSFLPKESAVRLSDGKKLQSSFVIAGNFCLKWQREPTEDPAPSISALISAIRPLPEMIVVGSAELIDGQNIPCSIEQTDPVSYHGKPNKLVL